MFSRLIATICLATACLLLASGEASLAFPHTLKPLSTERVVTCDDLPRVQRLSCGTGVIAVRSSLYGRRDRTTCSEGRPRYQLSNTRCSQRGFEAVIKNRCDGKSVCEISPSVVRFADPCFGTFKYMDTSFACFPARRRVVCENSFTDLRCGKGQVLFVYGADYGRHDRTTCSFDRPPEQLQNTHCSRPSNKVAERCNGKSSCSVTSSNSVFGDPCFGTYKYLEVTYTCHGIGSSDPRALGCVV